MRVGTIVQNLGAGLETYFVYTGEKPYGGKGRVSSLTKGYGITRHGKEWAFRKDCYAIDDLEDHERFPRVGYIDIEQVLTRDILRAIGKDE